MIISSVLRRVKYSCLTSVCAVRVKYSCLTSRVCSAAMQRAGQRLLPPAAEKSHFFSLLPPAAEKSRFSHSQGIPEPGPAVGERLKVTDGAGCRQCGRDASLHPAPGGAVFLHPAPGEGQAGTAATQILPANDIFLQSRAGANRSLHRAANGCRALPAPASGSAAGGPWSSCPRSLSRGARHPCSSLLLLLPAITPPPPLLWERSG